MSTFSRITGIALLIVSFCLIVSALPSPHTDDATWIVVDADTNPLCGLLAKFFTEMPQCQDLVTLKAKILVFVTLCNKCAADLLKIGADVKITAEAQASIITCSAAMITLLVKVLLAHCAKFGAAVVLTLCVELDVCLQLLLKNLDFCITGVVGLIVKACANAVVDGLATLSFKLCLSSFTGIRV